MITGIFIYFPAALSDSSRFCCASILADRDTLITDGSVFDSSGPTTTAFKKSCSDLEKRIKRSGISQHGPVLGKFGSQLHILICLQLKPLFAKFNMSPFSTSSSLLGKLSGVLPTDAYQQVDRRGML